MKLIKGDYALTIFLQDEESRFKKDIRGGFQKDICGGGKSTYN